MGGKKRKEMWEKQKIRRNIPSKMPGRRMKRKVSNSSGSCWDNLHSSGPHTVAINRSITYCFIFLPFELQIHLLVPGHSSFSAFQH